MASALSNGIRWVAARFAADPAPDGELLSRFLTSRDEEAFAELVRRHGPMVFATCRRVLGNAADADDAFQAVFVVLVRKGHTLTGRTCVGNFLYATAVLTARKARTMATRRRANEAKAVRPESVDPPGVDDEATRVLDEELAGLPEKYRGPVVLCELEGVSRREAAARLGIPEGTISSRLATAHRMLAKRLTARGFEAVAVAAALGKQAFAVPDSLATATVRAAAGGPPAGVTQLVAEVTKMLLWNKLRSGAALLAGVALLFGVGLLPSGGPEANAAPVPKAAATDGGLIWTYHYATGDLTAYTPEGVKAKAFQLKDGRQLRGITPDGSKLVFLGRNGQLADAADQKPGRTIHLRDIGEGTEGVDTGIAYDEGDQLLWSPDGTKVVRVAKQNQVGPRRGPGMTFVNTLIDVGTKKETPLRLPHDPEQVLAWSPDGKWLLTMHYTDTVGNGKVKHLLTEHHRFDLGKGTSEPLGETGQLYAGVVSPDGRSLFGQCIESRDSIAAGLKDLVMVRTDVATGKATEVARHEDQSFASARWSPGGKRVAYLWHKRADKSQAFLTLIDPDGKNPKTVTIPTPGGTANEIAILGWFPTRPAAKPREGNEKYTWNGEERTRAVRAVVFGGEPVEFVKVPAGKFRMGSPESDKAAETGERPQHRVTFTRDLWVAKHPVTKGQFAAFVKATGYKTEAETDGRGCDGFNGKAIRAAADFNWRATGWEQTDEHPVVNVTWNDAAKFCEWAAKESKVPIRLPTEAEYEYAARGGAETVYPTGDAAASLEGYANVADATAKGRLGMGWAVAFDDGEAFTSPVGKYKPNGFGLYDMTGNVWSWCADWSDGKVYARGDVTDPGANVDGAKKYRVLRGGSWYDHAKSCRAAYRSAAAPDGRTCNLGFRVVFAADPPPDEPKKEAKKADEPAWKAEFNKAYGLKDGELVKRLAPPYPECRTEYFRAVLERQRKRTPTDTELDFEVNNFTVFNWKDGTPSAGWQTHTEPERGVSLQFVLGTVLELHTTRIRDDANVLNQKITGDFVVRTGADREKMAVQLEAILRKELDLPVKLTFADEEEDVFVLSGKYEAKPLEGRKAEQVEVYSAHLTDRSAGGGGGGTFAAMAEAVERHVNRPVVLDKVEGVPARVFWHFNYRDLNDRIKKAQDTHPPTVLENLAAQTGLTLKEEKRKVRKLVIEQAELAK